MSQLDKAFDAFKLDPSPTNAWALQVAMVKYQQVEQQTLSDQMLKNSKIEEIKRLQVLNAQRTDLQLNLTESDEQMFVALSTRYWTWYPFHYDECPDADTGDLYLSKEDFYSNLIDEMIQSFRLLNKIKYFVEYYRIEKVEELKILILN